MIELNYPFATITTTLRRGHRKTFFDLRSVSSIDMTLSEGSDVNGRDTNDYAVIVIGDREIKCTYEDGVRIMEEKIKFEEVELIEEQDKADSCNGKETASDREQPVRKRKKQPEPQCVSS